MDCTEAINKKEFGLAVYHKLKEMYGQKRDYSVQEIKKVVEILAYPKVYECWALVAFGMTGNIGEYFRANGTPMDVLTMKKEFILAMTEGKKRSLSVPNAPKDMYEFDIPNLSKASLSTLLAKSDNQAIAIELLLDLVLE